MIDHRGSIGADPGQSSAYAPVSTIVKAGYAFASFKAGDIAPDNGDSYRSKMINLFYRADQPLPDNAGRTISAWAWGASRAMGHPIRGRDLQRLGVDGGQARPPR